MNIMYREARFLRVSEIREQKGLSVIQLAEKAGIAPNTALSYDRDSAAMINKDVLRKLANALDCTLRDLIVEE